MEDKDYYILVDYRCKINSLEDKIEKLEKTPITSQTEISDEEIEKVSNTLGDDYYASELIMWENGAKWYREQLKQRQ